MKVVKSLIFLFLNYFLFIPFLKHCSYSGKFIFFLKNQIFSQFFSKRPLNCFKFSIMHKNLNKFLSIQSSVDKLTFLVEKPNFPFNKIFKCFSGFYTSFELKWANLINWILKLYAFDFFALSVSGVEMGSPRREWQNHYTIIFKQKAYIHAHCADTLTTVLIMLYPMCVKPHHICRKKPFTKACSRTESNHCWKGLRKEPFASV